MIKLYSTHCPKCRVLEMKLKQAGYQFEVIDDEEEVNKMAELYSVKSVPFTTFEGFVYDFNQTLEHLQDSTFEIVEECSQCKLN